MFPKEHRPKYIVGMGLFMNANVILLAFDIHKRNKNKQITLKSLEEKIFQDFELSTFVVCTDARLSSMENHKFNDRTFITTQYIKKLKKHFIETKNSKKLRSF